jgi:uncharacterized protein YodC (DUF2158 family)
MARTVFEIGAVVMLKSGGQTATVSKVERSDVSVTWYSEVAGDFKTAVLPAAILEEVDFADDEDDEVEDD